jgi:hypothetical protein
MSEHSRRWRGVSTVWLAVCLVAAGTEAAGGVNAVLASVHGPFVFRFTEADRPLVGALERLADRSWDRLIVDLGMVRTEPITVILAPTDEAFNQLQPAGEPLPAWASGVAYPGLMTMVIRSYHVPGTPRQDIGTIFVHELTHLLLGARFGARPIPRWLNEGLAMYEAYEWEAGQEWTLVQAVVANRVPPLNDLTARFERGEVEARLAYLLAGALVNDMIGTYGREAFGNFVGRLAQGDSLDDAMVGAYGVSASLFEQRWRAHLDRRYAWIPILTSSSAVWAIVMGVTFAAYVARKRRNRKIRAVWATEAEREAETPPE